MIFLKYQFSLNEQFDIKTGDERIENVSGDQVHHNRSRQFQHVFSNSNNE